MKRTHTLGELREKNIGEKVELAGWVDTKRDLGGLTFMDLRDRTGKTQIVFPDTLSKAVLDEATKVKHEAVIRIKGEVKERYSKNPNLPTGNIEVYVEELEILNNSEALPLQVNSEEEAGENTRLQYRYLDIRRPDMVRSLTARHRMLTTIRNHMDKQGFLDVDTPLLTKSTPEGARDFLVPTRSGEFYALPQSPQLFKQLLMIGGIERYYQVAKCFRDEDLRADRQPEFTQLDIEMSFVDQRDVMAEIDGLLRAVSKDVIGVEIAGEIPMIPYHEAMERYGVDKPDTRFAVELKDISELMKDSGFKAFSSVVQGGGVVKAVVAPGGERLSRKNLTEYEGYLKTYFKAKGLAWIKISSEGELNSPIAKFFSEEELKEITKKTEAKNGDAILIVADKKKVVYDSLGALRIKIAEDFDLIDDAKYNFLWVTDFPMYEWSEEENRYKAQHHPFTSIKEADMELFLKGNKEELEGVRTNSYDIVLNGYEIGGGSIRIHNPEVQKKVFEQLGLSEKEVEEKFGFFVEAFKYGAPPHGGIAFGVDRWLMALLQKKSIRDVIPFPKTNKGQCLMTEAPSNVDIEQLKELMLEKLAKV